MAGHVLNVTGLFTISHMGIAVDAEYAHENTGKNLAIKIGDPVEFRIAGKVIVRSTIKGIPLGLSPSRNTFSFLIPPDISETDIPVGAEIWID